MEDSKEIAEIKEEIVKNIRPEHKATLIEKYIELYTKKFDWADEQTISNFAKVHYDEVIGKLDYAAYLSELP